jgi:transcriptional regulator with XRE-family HTH domain
MGLRLGGMPKGKTRLHDADYKKMLEKIYAARIAARLTQAQAAKRLGKPQSFVSKIETGERRVDPPELYQLAKVYGKDLLYFLADEDSDETENKTGDEDRTEEEDKTE